MNDMTSVFAKGKAVVPFITAGDPDAASTVKYILAMAEGGADMIVVSVPFSDPTAESPAAQEASLRALSGGMTPDGVLEILRTVRKKCDIPVLLTSYMNPVFFYGYDAFFSALGDIGAAFYTPDLPYEERGEIADIAAAHGVPVLTAVASSSGSRIPAIASAASGFVLIASPSDDPTGDDLAAAAKEVKKYTSVPVVADLGALGLDRASAAAPFDGVVTSYPVRLIASGATPRALGEYISELKKKINS